MHDDSDAAVSAERAIIALEPVALPIENVPQATGLARSRVFAAVANNELTVRKHGKATIVEVAELRRWISTFSTRGRKPESETVAA